MNLILLIEIIILFLLGIVCFIIAIVTHLRLKIKNIRSLFFIKLTFYNVTILSFLSALAILFMNKIFTIFILISIALIPIFIILFINYVMNEKYYSIGLLIVFSLSVLFIYVGIEKDPFPSQPDADYIRLTFTGLTGYLNYIIFFISGIYLFFWGIKTWINAPFLIKREATVFFLGICIATIGILIFYTLYFINPFFFQLCELFLVIGFFIFIFAIIHEPKLLFIIPFTVYRIVVKNQQGYPLYGYDWSKSITNEMGFSGFLNIIQAMSVKVMNIGGILDIKLKNGILILNKSKYITVGLVSSKSSRILRDSISKFTHEFEEKFEHLLKKMCIDMHKYESAYELIEKYFSNFPYRIIKDKKHPLNLSYRQLRLPQEIENRFNEIFLNDTEKQNIITEISKFPVNTSSEFIELYDELKDQIEEVDFNNI